MYRRCLPEIILANNVPIIERTWDVEKWMFAYEAKKSIFHLNEVAERILNDP